jgi:hypothetical protein
MDGTRVRIGSQEAPVQLHSEARDKTAPEAPRKDTEDISIRKARDKMIMLISECRVMTRHMGIETSPRALGGSGTSHMRCCW